MPCNVGNLKSIKINVPVALSVGIQVEDVMKQCCELVLYLLKYENVRQV